MRAGGNNRDNLAAACASCNGKRAKIIPHLMKDKPPAAQKVRSMLCAKCGDAKQGDDLNHRCCAVCRKTGRINAALEFIDSEEAWTDTED